MFDRAVLATRARAALMCAAAAVLVSCYSPRLDNCAVQCGADQSCPSGTTCGIDNFCHASGSPATCTDASVTFDGPTGDDGPIVDAPLSTSSFVMLSTGIQHTCGIDDSGSVAGTGRMFCWGRNEYGTLGAEPSVLARSGTPQLIEQSADDWVKVSAGGHHTCGIRGTALYCWGWNGLFQLGDPLFTGDALSTTPRVVMAGTAFKDVAAGATATCAIDSDDQVWCWGENTYAVLARGSSGGVSGTPMQILPGEAGTNAFRSVSVGREHACGIHMNGRVYCWGSEGSGRLGNNAQSTNQESPVQAMTSENSWSTVSVGTQHTCAVTTDGKLYCWGGNSSGQIGELPQNNSTTPQRVGTGTTWTTVDAGYSTTCAIRDFAVYCTGANQSGQLGLGDWRSSIAQFSPVSGAGAATEITVGDLHACARGPSGAWCWGANNDGQLAEPPANERVPTVVGSKTWKSVAAGDTHACAIDTGNELYCWGLNLYWQLGDSDQSTGGSRSTPVKVGSETDWDQVVVGTAHTCGRRAGQLWCWGGNDSNQVGVTGAAPKLPARIGSRADWSELGTRASSVCGVVSTGNERHCWGASGINQLGNGSVATVQSPTLVSDAIQWSSVSIGQRVGCGIGTDAQLYCWGDRQNGAVGDGMFSATNAQTPQPIGTGYSQVSSSLGVAFACGLKGGALYCWGYNALGQLGLGDGDPREVPTQVGSATNWTMISAGEAHTCGLLGGALHCWGFNPDGALGDGTTDTRNAPGAAVAAGTWKSVSAGHGFGCAIKDDDMLYCWGDGTFGQLGLGHSSRNAPVPLVAPN